MVKINIAILFVAVLMIFSSAFALTSDMEEFMAIFYGGLADIIEANMDHPANSIVEIQRYIAEHEDWLIEMHAQVSESVKLGERKSYREVIKKRSFQEMQRYYRTMQTFTGKNPDYELELKDTIEAELHRGIFAEDEEDDE